MPLNVAKDLETELAEARAEIEQINDMVKAAKDLLSYLAKAITVGEVDIVGTDIGAAGVRDRLQTLESAVKAAEGGKSCFPLLVEAEERFAQNL